MDVFLYPSKTCDNSGAELVSYSSPATYTFKESDAGETLFFACDISQRCEVGQYVIVTVAEASSEEYDTTPAFSESEINAETATVVYDGSSASVLYSFMFTTSVVAVCVLYFTL
jgi:hypothetical protein